MAAIDDALSIGLGDATCRVPTGSGSPMGAVRRGRVPDGPFDGSAQRDGGTWRPSLMSGLSDSRAFTGTPNNGGHRVPMLRERIVHHHQGRDLFVAQGQRFGIKSSEP
jgi:hypothetical protein